MTGLNEKHYAEDLDQFVKNFQEKIFEAKSKMSGERSVFRLFI